MKERRPKVTMPPLDPDEPRAPWDDPLYGAPGTWATRGAFDWPVLGIIVMGLILAGIIVWVALTT